MGSKVKRKIEVVSSGKYVDVKALAEVFAKMILQRMKAENEKTTKNEQE